MYILTCGWKISQKRIEMWKKLNCKIKKLYFLSEILKIRYKNFNLTWHGCKRTKKSYLYFTGVKILKKSKYFFVYFFFSLYDRARMIWSYVIDIFMNNGVKRITNWEQKNLYCCRYIFLQVFCPDIYENYHIDPRYSLFHLVS